MSRVSPAVHSRTAVVLAGGKGTRLAQYTITLPKPLVPVGEFPILEILIRQLAFHGFDDLILAVNHHAELIKAFCGDGTRWGVRARCSVEDKPLGTMGPLALIEDLPENFLILNGDILTDLDFSQFFETHVGRESPFTISSFHRRERSQYGVLETGPKGYLSGFHEKPWHSVEVSMGIYAASRRVLDLIPQGQAFGFDQLVLALLARGTPPLVLPHDGLWLDIGIPADCEAATALFEAQRSSFLKTHARQA